MTKLKEKVIDVLKSIYDPEIPVSIWELGLVYNLDVSDDNKIKIEMTLTTPMCPVAETIPGEVHDKIKEAILEAAQITVELVWEPPWTQEKMTEAAKLELGFM